MGRKALLWLAVGASVVAAPRVGAAGETAAAGTQQHAMHSVRFGEATAAGCPKFECGGNSPVVDSGEPANRAFHELHLAGLPNAAGFAVTGIRKGPTPYTFEVAGASVAARPKADPAAVPLTGAGLVGLVFDLRDSEGERYVLEIAGASTTTYWVRSPDAVMTYTLTYTSATQTKPQPLCTTETNEAILFTGDRYDAARKTVTGTGASTQGWMQIACAGTALAKLFLTRHTEASQVVPTTAAQRQAMLKMLTADVCGDGTSYTVHGQPLVWADTNGLTSFVKTPKAVEAIWSDAGALCLDTPRRPELASKIASHCGARLPRCASLTDEARAKGYVTSAIIQ